MKPRSRVWMSSMKLIRARSIRAAAARETVKRDPAILAARSKSRIPRPVPRSQWASGSKSNSRGSPARRTSTLPEASAPTGTDSSGRLGILRRVVRILSSSGFSPSSRVLIRSPTSLVSAIRAAASRPDRLRPATSSEALFRRDRRSSTSRKVSFLASDRRRNSERSIRTPRWAHLSMTRPAFSRTNLGSSMAELYQFRTRNNISTGDPAGRRTRSSLTPAAQSPMIEKSAPS
ncbi:MAG: hypothetical protein BWX98_01098 [Candidatus Aminicenantes bacterium ADurb.Bin147]|nr:MAG: hypothetical protein BWX98_01098 [Candidatus Aminicenantes bacterium ADurb.Bin147]